MVRRRPRNRLLAVLLAGLVLAGCSAPLAGSAQPGSALAPTGPQSGVGGSGPASPPAEPPTPAPTGASPTGPESISPGPPSAADPAASTSGTAASAAGTAASASRTAATARTSWALGSRITDAPRNAYGDLQVRRGQVVGLSDSATGQDAIVWSVDAITFDPPCWKDSSATATNGHFLLIAIRIERRDASTQALTNATIGFGNLHWTAYDARGVAQPQASGLDADECIAPQQQAPDVATLVPGRPVSALVPLDVGATSGTVVLHFADIDGGWEYHYG